MRRDVLRGARTPAGEGQKPPITPDFSEILSALQDLSAAGESADRAAEAVAKGGDPAAVRRLNDALIQVERAFLNADGLPKRPWFRHMLIAPGLTTGYAPWPFPALQQAIEERDAGNVRRRIQACRGRAQGRRRAPACRCWQRGRVYLTFLVYSPEKGSGLFEISADSGPNAEEYRLALRAVAPLLGFSTRPRTWWRTRVNRSYCASSRCLTSSKRRSIISRTLSRPSRSNVRSPRTSSS